jgi:Kef-type K+ transport system membrane component KefB
MILFFVLSGASLRPETLEPAGIAIAAFLLLRLLGRALGGMLGAWLAAPEPDGSRRLGLAMLPQAGVAMGMALIAAQSFPEHADRILPVVITTIVVFEIVGPMATRAVIRSWGEHGKARD